MGCKILILSQLIEVYAEKEGFIESFSSANNQFIHLSFQGAWIIRRLFPIFAIPF
jgi:hypothetical protein